MGFPNAELSINELSFTLFQRSLHPELFKIYRSQQFFQGDYEVNIWITGCSHVLSVYHGGGCLTELISMPDQMLPARGLIERFAFRGEKNFSCKWADNFVYMMNFQVETMSENLYRHAHKELVKITRQRGIYVPYPQWTGDGNFIPFSYIDYEARWEELHIQTFHAFPDKLTIIKTQSLFDMKRR